MKAAPIRFAFSLAPESIGGLIGYLRTIGRFLFGK